MRKNNRNQKFPGFPPKPTMNFWSYPKILNGYSHSLTGSEQKVLDYILRRTWGFNKNFDEISLGQLEKGIKNLDRGTGLSRTTIIKSIKGLVAKGFIKKMSGKKANHYELVKDLNYPSTDSVPSASTKSVPTIDNITIKNKQYSFSSKKKAYFRGNPMRWVESKKKWYVIENGQWLKFVGLKSQIDWR